jgi:hypothetical protein
MTSKVACPECNADELTLGLGSPKCRCGHGGEPAQIADQYIERFLKRPRDADWPLSSCPRCAAKTLVDQREDVGCPAFVCFQCGTTWEVDDLAYRKDEGRWVKA